MRGTHFKVSPALLNSYGKSEGSNSGKAGLFHRRVRKILGDEATGLRGQILVSRGKTALRISVVERSLHAYRKKMLRKRKKKHHHLRPSRAATPRSAWSLCLKGAEVKYKGSKKKPKAFRRKGNRTACLYVGYGSPQTDQPLK